MTSLPPDVETDLREENARLTRELSEALQQQTATAEVLQIINSSPGDLAPVFGAILEKAMRLCEAHIGALWTYHAEYVRAEASRGAPPAYAEYLEQGQHRPSRAQQSLLSGQSFVQVADITASESYRSGDPMSRAAADLGGVRTLLIVPLLKDGAPIGQFSIYRQEVRPFSDKQIALLQKFADQAVIAISNARLFDEVQARTHEFAASLDELRTAQDRLVQTEKLASLGQLTAGIAHEIKNPLNFVINFSALSAELIDALNEVLGPTNIDDNTREEIDDLTQILKGNLEKVVQHGKRADSIVKNMLLHSREGSGEHRPADINALLEESLNLAYHGARAEKPQFNVTLRRDFDETAGAIELFPQEITRVFLNLISNGFYAVTKRKIETGDSGFEPTVSATTRNLGHAVEIRIRDNGTGIPPEVKEKMFNPFFTTKPVGEGTGLGLSMSYDIIVKQHGGRVEVETEPGQFTEFTVVLPRTNNPANKTEIRGQT